MKFLDGRSMAAEIGRGVVDDVERLRQAGVVPTLGVVLPTSDAAARSYVRVIERTAAKVGVRCIVHELSGDPTELLTTVDRLAADDDVHGLIVQTPLPAGLSAADIGARIPAHKDVDGMNPLSLGRLALGLPCFAPATAAAVLEILHRSDIKLAGTRTVVIGRSPVVGKPASLLLLAEDATVTVCHSRTTDLISIVHEADIVVAAVGRPRMIGKGFIRTGATVIDVGTNVTDSGLVGDVDAEAVASVAGALTPVPGGVGPVTTMLLLRNTTSAVTP
ncbi:bifunctional 5,10-methylenetetrahydrofolate dehydrogenase/5,10-methenyltetrahydrofolate cyclohydrolase [Frankia sp. Cppng1_Ct_nod]|uniref:bifunctional 5,10-methylenetetrahydrofolate dehydrogenase/5,10-methenyltetrahydrofolate cyclohydrolase n=1 Tax=Frankia sp. Cppng1_Ct_nod TaxID=2897162 RepID=UPI0010410D77|nr:bifunctional 5,10-methylenetetrahydrofolate dehydrogenase/5,10-methenyltetrahydrofolate cyclohydrolase [Frankia sp. Cppng1_Ct_nod]